MNTQQDDSQHTTDDSALNEIQQKIKEQEELNAKEEVLTEAEEEMLQAAALVGHDLQKKCEEYERVAKEAAADLANFKRRSEEEKKSFAQFATANLVLELLQVTDNFDRALQNIPEGLEGNEWLAGIQGIDQQFHGILQKQGVAQMTTVGEKLDIIQHEALMQGPGEKDVVVEELEKGYMMGDRVLRPAKVKVGNGEAA